MRICPRRGQIFVFEQSALDNFFINSFWVSAMFVVMINIKTKRQFNYFQCSYRSIWSSFGSILFQWVCTIVLVVNKKFSRWVNIILYLTLVVNCIYFYAFIVSLFMIRIQNKRKKSKYFSSIGIYFYKIWKIVKPWYFPVYVWAC